MDQQEQEQLELTQEIWDDLDKLNQMIEDAVYTMFVSVMVVCARKDNGKTYGCKQHKTFQPICSNCIKTQKLVKQIQQWDKEHPDDEKDFPFEKQLKQYAKNFQNQNNETLQEDLWKTLGDNNVD